MGGNSPQSLVNQACLAIQAGDGRPRAARRAPRRGAPARASARPAASSTGPGRATTSRGPRRRPRTSPCRRPGEMARGVMMPDPGVPALRAGLPDRVSGRGLDEHLVAMSELWARFSEVAAGNPNAWIQRAYTAEEIRTPSPDNRMIGFPYTKLMNSNNAVEQGAGVILCSAERAESLGVPRDRWVFPHSGTDAHDHYFVSNRDSPRPRRPAMRIGWQRRRSSWPASASTTSPTSTSTPASRPPWRSRPPSSASAPTVRSRSPAGCRSPAGRGTTTSCTRSPRWPTCCGPTRAPSASSRPTAASSPSTRSASTAPSRRPSRSGTPSRRPRSTRLPRRELCEEPDGDVAIETWTVMHDRDGAPETGILAGLLDDGRRAWGSHHRTGRGEGDGHRGPGRPHRDPSARWLLRPELGPQAPSLAAGRVQPRP